MSLNHDKSMNRVPKVKWTPGLYFRIPKSKNVVNTILVPSIDEIPGKPFTEECIKKTKKIYDSTVNPHLLNTIWGRLGKA